MSRALKCDCGGLKDEAKNLKKRLTTLDYDRPAVELAKYLLGKVLVRRTESGQEMQGVIVETEAYAGGPDKASMSYNGKRTNGNAPMYMKPGTAFVYMTYGMYHCFNISSQGEGSAVLLRAVEPTYGLDDMRRNKRSNSKVKKKAKEGKEDHKSVCIKEICNGPSKMCMAFDIDKKLNTDDMDISSSMWIETNYDVDSDRIVSCSRIGLKSQYYGEWAKKPFRYYIQDNPYISKKAPASEICEGNDE